MICREQDGAFVMMKQHEHGELSGVLAEWIKEERGLGEYRREEVLRAVAEHDRGWIDLDETPFWNDAADAPYTFFDFPLVPKLTFYQRGLNEIEADTPYGALLCSLHFDRLIDISGEDYPELTVYQEHEKARRARIRHELEATAPIGESELRYDSHLLQFCDDLSLYLGLNKPGSTKAEGHPWWRDGFSGSEDFSFTSGQRITATWKDEGTLILNPFPFRRQLEVSFKQRRVQRSVIKEKGIASAYKEAPEEEVHLVLTGPEQ
ncbi:DUF3891 family protein [Paenibacillus sp. NPDC056722]|uniref:DUF3891 family protein n=1 Tax=Paenibacillus sp. NPDC056722 TaxID=3345924 RepID=UPI0036962F79